MCSSSPVPPLLLHLLSRFLHHHILYIFFLLYTSDCQHSMCMLLLHSYDPLLEYPSDYWFPLFLLHLKRVFRRCYTSSMLHIHLLYNWLPSSRLLPDHAPWLLPSVHFPLFGFQKQNFQMLHCMLLILVMCSSSPVPPLLLHLLSRLPHNYILYNVHLQYTSDCQNPTYNLFLLQYYDFPPNHIYNHCI